MQNYKMIVVMVDGYYVKFFDVYNFDIYFGQIYDVFFIVNQDMFKNYWVVINVCGRNFLIFIGFVVIQYLLNLVIFLFIIFVLVSFVWNDIVISFNFVKKFLVKFGYEFLFLKKCDCIFVFLGIQNEINGNVKWVVNNIFYVYNVILIIVVFKYKIKGVNNFVLFLDFFVESYNIFVLFFFLFVIYGIFVYVFEKDDIVDVIV